MKFAIGSDVSAGTGASNSVSSIVNIATGEKIGVFEDTSRQTKRICLIIRWPLQNSLITLL